MHAYDIEGTDDAFYFRGSFFFKKPVYSMLEKLKQRGGNYSKSIEIELKQILMLCHGANTFYCA